MYVGMLFVEGAAESCLLVMFLFRSQLPDEFLKHRLLVLR